MVIEKDHRLRPPPETEGGKEYKMKRITKVEQRLRAMRVTEERIKARLDFNRSIRSAAKREGISLRGQSGDIPYWNGYSYQAYRYVACTIKDGLVDDIWEGFESGNFLPQNCCYIVMTKVHTAENTIEEIWNQF